MTVKELLSIKNSRVSNRDKALLITRMQKLIAKRNNPQQGEIPTGWNASPFQGSRPNHET